MEYDVFRLYIVFILFLCSLSAVEKAEEKKDPLAGHSYHGEAFNEGPRQAAHLMGGTGNVDFEITTKSEKAKAFFLQGVGQIHGFWYFEAERSFRQVAVLDSKCAMAYWGMAQANTSNQTRAREFLSKAYEHIEGVSAREKMYIDSYAARIGLPTDAKGLAAYKKNKKKYKIKRSDKDRRGDYVKKLEDIVLEYPDDLEAKAFLVVNLYSNSRSGHPINSYVAVNALANEILIKKPFHPTNHFVIHLWDRKKAKIALTAAARGGQGSPSIAHMWHMPGHIYSRLQRFADAAWHQEASARTDHRHMMEDLVLPDQIHNFAHNNEWLSRNLINLGRVHDAYSLVQNMCELPMHPKYNTYKKGSARYGRMRLVQVLSTYEMWEEAISLENTPYLDPTDVVSEKMKRLRVLGRASFSVNDLVKGNRFLTEAEAQLAEITAKAVKKFDADKKKKEDAAKKKKEEVAKKAKDGAAKSKKQAAKKTKSKKPAKRKIARDEEYAKESILELKLIRALIKGDIDEMMKDRKDLKGIDKWVQVQIYLALKKYDKAIAITKKDVDDNKNKVHYLVRHIYTLYEADKKEESKKNFDYLRTIGEDVDLGAPLFLRLTAIAADFEYPEDWRLKRKVYKDIEKRPALADLGSFRWQPIKAKKWSLSDSENQQVTLEKINDDQAILLIFYLGAECLHCVEQLNAFAPMKEKYAKAGIKMVAVSTEHVKELGASVSKYGDDGKFPFTILSDGKLDIFKKYRCYDDFEKMALHGTFLIDRNGYIRWQDISYEPFTKPEFLLKESIRLLNQPEKLIYGKSVSQVPVKN